jgi:hypothetical protein
MRKIILVYSHPDGFKKTGRFTTLGGARRFTWTWVGQYPTLNGRYVIAPDGQGRVLMEGCTGEELYPEEEEENDMEVAGKEFLTTTEEIVTTG